MKFGKPLLYILVVLVLSSFFDNTSINTIQEMTYTFGRPLSNFVYSQCDMLPFDSDNFYCNTIFSLFYNKGHIILALTFVLIFYLGFDKKVWKS